MLKARALGHLENVNTFCDNLEQAMAQLGEKLFAFEYLQFNCEKEFVWEHNLSLLSIFLLSATFIICLVSH